MNDFEKINTDLATLFREGRALLDAGNSAVMNGCREEAFRKFVDLGGIPNKQEDYIYLNKYNTSHKWVIIGDSQEHPYKGTFDGNGQKIVYMNVEINGNMPEKHSVLWAYIM